LIKQGKSQKEAYGNRREITSLFSQNARWSILSSAAENIGEKIDDDVVIIAADSTGIKITNRGPQWMQEMWDAKNKKGYLKIHM
jgi:hypothetical protein